MFEFTFHYVSINSGDAVKVNDYDTNLHSTMYLLILSETVNRTVSNTYLHSTMYLLIQERQPYKKLSSLIYIPLCIY